MYVRDTRYKEGVLAVYLFAYASVVEVRALKSALDGPKGPRLRWRKNTGPGTLPVSSVGVVRPHR